MGCDTLLVATDHAPLIKLFGDRTLDEISNTRLFRLKERALPWKFSIQYVPGKLNPFADATSRYPSGDMSEDEGLSTTEILAGLRIVEDMDDNIEDIREIASVRIDLEKAQTVSWERVKSATTVDQQLCQVSNYIRKGSECKQEVEEPIQDFWQYRNDC